MITDNGAPNQCATSPASQFFPTAGPPMKKTIFTPVMRPRIRSGVSSLADDVPQHHAHGIGRAGERQTNEREPETARQAEDNRREPVADHRPKQDRVRAARYGRQPHHDRAREHSPDRGSRIQPAVSLAPTWRTSCAKIGNSAVADEKNVAKKSSSMVERIMGEREDEAQPFSPAACRLIFPRSLSAGAAEPRA